MSLVNDMLRDLDQRRSKVDSAAAVHLTPASEQQPGKEQRRMLLALGGIAVVVIALAGVWWYQTGSDSSRELNIRPQSATPPVALNEESSPASEQVVSEVVPESVPTALTEVVSTAVPEPAPPAPAPAPTPVLQQVTPEPVDNRVTSPEAVSGPAAEQTDEIATTPPESQAVPPPSSSALEQPQVAVRQQPGESVSAPAAVESVKDQAELTSEEADTMAVQDALDLIAENQLTRAYTVLEQEILANRYAHRSRETYAKLLLSQGDRENADALIAAGLQLAPNHPGFKKVKARILINERRIDEAIGLLLSRAPEVAEDLEYHEILASAQLASRDFEGALISYRSLVQMDQTQGRFWYGFAASQDSLGNSQAARQGYSQAMQLANLSPNLRRRSQERLSALSQ